MPLQQREEPQKAREGMTQKEEGPRSLGRQKPIKKGGRPLGKGRMDCTAERERK